MSWLRSCFLFSFLLGLLPPCPGAKMVNDPGKAKKFKLTAESTGIETLSQIAITQSAIQIRLAVENKGYLCNDAFGLSYTFADAHGKKVLYSVTDPIRLATGKEQHLKNAIPINKFAYKRIKKASVQIWWNSDAALDTIIYAIVQEPQQGMTNLFYQ